ncbi:hypothetical protein SAMN05216375_12349 [Trichococcus ilyis]|uniref:Uncharacterized protein n=1 Tax=Trichococcus ilyis TaxID=640938 RepID=A0A143YZL6_9LACT|nr:Hypothetical protein TR210_1661 [Trichococcus ilyis]SEJ72486.1 hypothetical protein SAMN05216375_12349 [Trichococcus ilyis]
MDTVLSFALGWSLAFITEPTLIVALDMLALFFIYRVWREIVWFNEQESKKDDVIVHE